MRTVDTGRTQIEDRTKELRTIFGLLDGVGGGGGRGARGFSRRRLHLLSSTLLGVRFLLSFGFALLQHIAQRFLIDADVPRNEGATHRVERKGFASARFEVAREDPHRPQQPVRRLLGVPLERLGPIGGEERVETEHCTLCAHPLAILLRLELREDASVDTIVCGRADQRAAQPSQPQSVRTLRLYIERGVNDLVVDPMDIARVALQSLAYVHPHVVLRDGRKVASLVVENLGQPGAIHDIDHVWHVLLHRDAHRVAKLVVLHSFHIACHLIEDLQERVVMKEARERILIDCIRLEQDTQVQVDELCTEKHHTMCALDRVYQKLAFIRIGHELLQRASNRVDTGRFVPIHFMRLFNLFPYCYIYQYKWDRMINKGLASAYQIGTKFKNEWLDKI